MLGQGRISERLLVDIVDQEMVDITMFFFTNFCSRKRKPKRSFSHEKKAKRMFPAGRKISSGYVEQQCLKNFT